MMMMMMMMMVMMMMMMMMMIFFPASARVLVSDEGRWSPKKGARPIRP